MYKVSENLLKKVAKQLKDYNILVALLQIDGNYLGSHYKLEEIIKVKKLVKSYLNEPKITKLTIKKSLKVRKTLDTKKFEFNKIKLTKKK